MSFDKIFTHGNLVDVDVGRWTARRKLKSADIGLEQEDISNAFSLGHRKLIPDEVDAKFMHLSYLARACLIRHSHPADFGQARFVPKKTFASFVEEFTEIQEEYNREREELCANLPKYKLEMRNEYTKAALQAYERLTTLCGFNMERDEYVNNYLERIEKEYPTVDEIRNKYRMEFVVFHVSLPDLSQATYEDLASDSEKVQLMRVAYEKAMNRRVERFVDGIVTSLRSNAVTVMSRVATNIKEGKKLTVATINSLKKLLQDYERLDVVGDQLMVERLRDLKDRVLDHVTPKDLAESTKLRENIRKELETIVRLAEDEQGIKALVEAYRQKIGM